MTKTSEFHTLLRNYRGIMGNIWINKIWISFDSCFFNYYADDDEIQFNLAGQEGVITIPAVISYDKIDEEDLFEDSVAGYTATLESGDTVTFYCFNAKNKSWFVGWEKQTDSIHLFVFLLLLYCNPLQFFKDSLHPLFVYIITDHT